MCGDKASKSHSEALKKFSFYAIILLNKLGSNKEGLL